MRDYDASVVEKAIWAVLGGEPMGDAANGAGISPSRLAEAVERYRSAGRASLDTCPEGWHQVNIEFADYPTAAETFRTYLLPCLRGAPVGEWWFVRKYPCWRLRVHPSPDTPVEETLEHVTTALDSGVSWNVVKAWRPHLYEPENVAFGGSEGMAIAHRVFHTDSLGVLDYYQHVARRTDGLLDAKATSMLVTTLFMRAAGLEWGEQGDVWGQIEARRPLPEDVTAEKVSAMVDTMRQLLMVNARSSLTDGPLVPLQSWVTGMECGGRALADTARDGRLGLGLRRVLFRHVVFHWNRMGFSVRQQAIWSRAAREATLGQ